MLFQIMLTVFIVGAVFRLCVQYKTKRISGFYFYFFLIVWLGILFLNWNNSLLNKFGALMGLGRGVNFLLYLGMFVLFYHAFVVTVRLYSFEQKMHNLIKKDAIDDFKREYGDKKSSKDRKSSSFQPKS